MSNKKPIGIILISIYSAFSGVTTLLGGLGLFLLLNPVSNAPSSFTLIGLVLLVLGVFLIASVYGLWTLKEWGRNMAKWLYILLIPLAIVGMPGEEFNSSDALIQMFNIGIAAIIIWYLSKPNIQELYEA